MPTPLQKDELIYITSPAKAIEPYHVAFAEKFFVENGFRVEVAEHALGTNHYFSGTVEQRLSDFQTGLDHPEAKVILCARGGYGCMQLLDKLDWTKFNENPKLIVGFSDVTAFHLLVNEQNIPSLHGTMPLNFEENTAETLRSLLSCYTGNPEEIKAPIIPFNQFGTARGKVVGGNLAMVHAMLPKLNISLFQDNILFLEDVGEHLYKVDRMLYGLKYAGVLDAISGLAIGSFTSMSDTDSPFGKSLEEIILSHVSHRKIPVSFGLPCGHQPDNQALIMGGSTILTVDSTGTRVIQSFLENLI